MDDASICTMFRLHHAVHRADNRFALFLACLNISLRCFALDSKEVDRLVYKFEFSERVGNISKSSL